MIHMFAAGYSKGTPGDLVPDSTSSSDRNSRGLLKAKDLLAKRGILNLLSSLNLSARQYKEYSRRLLILQAAIFDLDYYGEENWLIETSALTQHWQRIEAAAGALSENLVTELDFVRAYQRIELAIRAGNPVARVPIHVFYKLKTCDVWVMQKFLSDVAVREGLNILDSTGCQVLNIVQEIRDDLDDVVEDILTYNGNRILSMCRTCGVDDTIHEYEHFLFGLVRLAQQKCVEIQPNYDGHGEQIWIEIIETANALRTAITNPDTLELLSFAENQFATKFPQPSAA